jgi:hypothetical protein
VARDLRNLAGPTPFLPTAVDVAGPADLVFKTVDATKLPGSLNGPNVKRVRYCLDAGSRTLWQQEQRWQVKETPAMPPTGACPSDSWGGATALVTDVTNAARPVFTYDSPATNSIASVGVLLHVDDQVDAGPPETTISTGVFLRNQNRGPTAAFTATVTAQGIQLNGSASSDPEGQPLDYVWYDGGTKVGNGVTFLYAATRGVPHTITLRVYDPARLEGISAPRTVTP